MTEMVKEIILLEMEALKNKKELIEMYSGHDDAVSQIITQDSRAAIRQIQESIKYFATI